MDSTLLLLEAGADVNASDHRGHTPLIRAGDHPTTLTPTYHPPLPSPPFNMKRRNESLTSS